MRRYREWAPPDPGPGQRILALPPKEPATEAAVLRHAYEINSLATLQLMVPTEAMRTALYGGGLMDEEAKISKPSKTGAVGEGRQGFVLGKKEERIHAQELDFDAAEEGLGTGEAGGARASSSSSSSSSEAQSKTDPNVRLRMAQPAAAFRQETSAGVARSVWRGVGTVDDSVVIFKSGEQPRARGVYQTPLPVGDVRRKLPQPGAPSGQLAAASATEVAAAATQAAAAATQAATATTAAAAATTAAAAKR